MRTPQELREIILELLDEQGANTHQMLKKCGYNTSLVNDLKKGQMPSADKLANIAKFLGVTTDFLLHAESLESEYSQTEADNFDEDFIKELRREFYGNSAIRLTPEDKKNILDMVKILLQMKSSSQMQKRESAD